MRMRLPSRRPDANMFVCIHIKERRCLLNPDEIIEAISNLSGPGLDRVRKALEQRREQLKQSMVAERRNYSRGILQLEYRSNPKTGTQRGPYWYFYWREGGK